MGFASLFVYLMIKDVCSYKFKMYYGISETLTILMSIMGFSIFCEALIEKNYIPKVKKRDIVEAEMVEV